MQLEKRKNHKPRIIIYGVPKIGKTTFATNGPCPIVTKTEDGASGINVDQMPLCESWYDVLAQAKSVAEEDHKYETYVIDVLNGVELLCAKSVATDDDWAAGFGGFQAYRKVATAINTELLPLLDKCRNRGMYVVLIAHSGIHSVKTAAEEYSKFAPSVSKWVWEVFNGWADMIGRADYRYIVGSVKNGKGKASVEVDNTGKPLRKIWFSGSPARDCGTLGTRRTQPPNPPQSLPTWRKEAQHHSERQ